MTKKHCFWTIYKFEILKILKNKVAVATLLILLGFSFIQAKFEISGNLDPEQLTEYAELNNRPVNDEFLKELLSVTDEYGEVVDAKDRKYDEFNSWVDTIAEYGSGNKALTVELLEQRRQKSIEDLYKLEELSEAEIKYWEEKEKELKQPLVFHDTVKAAGVLEGTSNNMVMIVLIISVSLASIFAMETQRRTDPMVRASINGSGELYFAKILAGISYVLACAAVLMGSFFVHFGLLWGFDGLEASIINYRPFTNLNFSVWQTFGVMLMLLVLGAVMTAAFTLFISNVSRNSLATMAVALGAYMAVFAASTSIPYKARGLSQLLSLFPGTLVSSRLVYEFRMLKLGRFFLSYEIAPGLYLIMTILFVFAGYFVYRRHEIKNT